MAKRIIWCADAKSDRQQILAYSAIRNRSKIYSRKLNNFFRAAVEQLSDFPKIGKPSEFPPIRSKLVGDYRDYYEEMEQDILILAIWDIRRDDTELKVRLSE